jgi:hypothetical protein
MISQDSENHLILTVEATRQSGIAAPRLPGRLIRCRRIFLFRPGKRLS